MIYRIYKITNLINGKIYIGQTRKTLKERFDKHASARGKSSLPLYVDMKNFGVYNFKIELIEIAKNPKQRELACVVMVGR